MAQPVKKNVVLLGHSGCGKTMLVEAMLYKAGVINRMGSIREGNTVSDFDPEEKERQASINSTVVHLSWKDVDVNVLDAPGYPDFVGQAIPAASVADAALLCVSAVAGIEVNTRHSWKLLESLGLPRAVVITKLDGENADFEKCVGEVQETFGKKCRVLMRPEGDGVSFVLDGEGEEKDALVEAVVEVDEDLLNRYLEGEEISAEEIKKALKAAVASGEIVPILCVAAEKEIGVETLLDFVVEVLPDASQKVLPLAEDSEEPGDAFSAQVFKLVSDPFVGKISFMRVFTGKVEDGQTVVNTRSGNKIKLAHIFRAQGKEQEPVKEAVAGDIVCAAKIEDLQIGDTVVMNGGKVVYRPFDAPEPMVALAVEPKKRGDEAKISGALEKLTQEDITFKVTRDSRTNEMVISGMSTLHLDVMLSRLKDRFDVEVETKDPKIPYKETITRGAQGHHKHKKQTGGRGQYGEVYLRVAPRERGEGFEFRSEVVGGNIPSQYIPAVEKGVRETMEKGVLAGYPVDDIEVVVYDGSYHTVDSSEASFKIAASKAFKDAFMNARPCLLEPVVEIQVTVPASMVGEITGDINSRRGKILGIDAHGSMQTITAHVPLAEVTRYSTDLRSMTGGEGSYTLQFSHYDIVPQHIAEKLIQQKQQEDEEE